jgi:Arc/MetJ-type ribon-helix-helix transcriptional regulator
MLQVKNAKLEKFIQEQVKAGYFPSPEAAVEAAVEQMKLDQAGLQLTDADIRAINEAETQIDGGESVDFDTFAAEMRKKYCNK